MKVKKIDDTGLFLIEPSLFKDERGFFTETYSKKVLAENGLHAELVQDNHSRSSQRVLRGLHYQEWPGGQAKLVRCMRGTIQDVVVDIRPKSPTYLKHFKFFLSEENRLQLYIPVGFAHGFVVLSEVADVVYKCSAYYDPELEKGYRWDDPVFKIEWAIENPIVSERDQKAPFFS